MPRRRRSIRAGVGLLSDLPVIDRRYGLPGLDEDVDSGRWIEADVRTPQGYVITVACVYVHAGNSDDEVKMTQKYRFLDTMLVRLGQLRDEAASGGRQAVLCGDFNIAHTPLDIKNAKANEKHAGFLPEERAYVAGAPSTTTSAGGSTISSPRRNSRRPRADSSSTKPPAMTHAGPTTRR